MSKLNIYHEEQDIPPLLHQQILDFQRLIWDDGFQGENMYRQWICRTDFDPIFFVMTHEEIVISCACVVHQMLEHKGCEYITYGVAGVFTYPQFRNQGYGLELVKEARKYIETTDADIILFTTTTTGFYEKAGFIPMPNTNLLHGDKENPKQLDEKVYMEFVSEKGKNHRDEFKNSDIFFGRNVW